MIEMRITGCCEKCEYMNLVLDHKAWALDGQFYSLLCTHQNVCGALIKERSRAAIQTPEDCRRPMETREE